MYVAALKGSVYSFWALLNVLTSLCLSPGDHFPQAGGGGGGETREGTCQGSPSSSHQPLSFAAVLVSERRSQSQPVSSTPSGGAKYTQDKGKAEALTPSDRRAPPQLEVPPTGVLAIPLDLPSPFELDAVRVASFLDGGGSPGPSSRGQSRRAGR